MLLELKPLRLVFWGLLLAFLDLNIAGFDVLPDLIGFVLMLAGLHRLKQYGGQFAVAEKCAAAGVVCGLLSFRIFGVVSAAAAVAGLILLWIVTYLVFSAAAKLAKDAGEDVFASKSGRAFSLLVFVSLGSTALGFFGFLGGLMLFLLIAVFCITILLLGWLWQAAVLLDGRYIEQI